MYAIKQTFHRHGAGPPIVKLLGLRYKTPAGAEKGAQRYRWVCRPQGSIGPVEESRAQVVEVRQ